MDSSSLYIYWFVNSLFTSFQTFFFKLGVSLTILVWPPGEIYDRFLLQFLIFSFFQGIFVLKLFILLIRIKNFGNIKALVQMLQTRYQTAKLYKMIAMGKASRMDVTVDTSSEITESSCSPGLYFLLPFLLFMQVSSIQKNIFLFLMILFTNKRDFNFIMDIH